MRDRETIDTIFIKGLQNFDKYDIINPTEIKIEEDKFLKNLQKYFNKNYMHRFLVDALLFSSGITNEASVLFITCNGLSEASEAIINGKPYKLLGVIKLDQIKN